LPACDNQLCEGTWCCIPAKYARHEVQVAFLFWKQYVVMHKRDAVSGISSWSCGAQVAGYAGLLMAMPTVLYEIIAYVVPGLTISERRLLAPVVFGSSILFYAGLLFSYEVLTPAALNFFVSYADGAVESLWSIDQYFEFVLILMLSTGLSFQVRPQTSW
jgi:Tat protein translocase TatC